MNNIFNTAFFHTVLAFLLAVTGQLSAQLQKDLANGNILLVDQTLELKKEISGGATIDLIDGTTERIDGECSFDKNKLQQGRAFVFDRVSIGYATHATVSGLQTNIAYNTAAPKELQNALLIINQDGREVLRLPVRDLNNISTGYKASDEYTELRNLAYLADDRTITIQLKFPPNVTLDASKKHYVYIRLNGGQTTKKANVA